MFARRAQPTLGCVRVLFLRQSDVTTSSGFSPSGSGDLFFDSSRGGSAAVVHEIPTQQTMRDVPQAVVMFSAADPAKRTPGKEVSPRAPHRSGGVSSNLGCYSEYPEYSITWSLETTLYENSVFSTTDDHCLRSRECTLVVLTPSTTRERVE